MADQQKQFEPGPLGPVEGQIFKDAKIGMCDPSFREAPAALSPFRYSTGVFRLILSTTPGATAQYTAGTAGGGAVGNDLVCQNTTGGGGLITLFSYGVGDDMASVASTAGFPNTYAAATQAGPALTDSLQGGAPVDVGEVYVVVGIATQIMRPAELTGRINTTCQVAWVYDAWQANYEEEVREAFLTHTWVEFAYKNSAFKYRLGAPESWPQMGGPTGPVVSNGRPMVATFMPFRTVSIIAGRDQAKQLNLNCNVGEHAIVIKNDPAVPTQNDLFVPIRAHLIGFPVCGQDAAACMVVKPA